MRRLLVVLPLVLFFSGLPGMAAAVCDPGQPMMPYGCCHRAMPEAMSEGMAAERSQAAGTSSGAIRTECRCHVSPVRRDEATPLPATVSYRCDPPVSHVILPGAFTSFDRACPATRSMADSPPAVTSISLVTSQLRC